MKRNLSANPIMKKWIDENGLVDYQKIKTSEWFWDQVKIIETINLAELSKNEEFAFWLNAYNLLTVLGVLHKQENKPDWTGNITLFSKLRFFFLTKHKVAGKKLSLNYIEHKILRKKFKDPRIHFVINCGSKSCPYLPGNIVQSETLDKTLNGLASFFINSGNVQYNKSRNILTLSRIFKWYKRDFAQVGGVLNFVAKYWKGEKIVSNELKLKYEKYDWTLNSKNK